MAFVTLSTEDRKAALPHHERKMSPAYVTG